ncbi:MAG: hypothetical protein F4Y05_03225 [Acidimicrobiaceae bacterium]|nr:hypothetical protein [Acidimicrobiaceae bacterium]MYI36039.1 hypothetical protein [Acidimicrobiaceae bacterium]
MTLLKEFVDIRPGLAMAGRGAGAQPGDWMVRVVDSADIVDDRLHMDGLRNVLIRQSVRTAAHLLEPWDILVTARSPSVKVALVPPGASRTVASTTLLVVRTADAGTGLAHFLWYYLTSSHGRAEVAARYTTTTIPTLSARALGEVPVVVPPPRDLPRFADLVEASTASRDAALEAVHARHDVVRDSVISAIAATDREVG